MKLSKLGWVFAAGVALAACDDPLQTDPQSAIPADEALTTAEQLRVGVNGMYDSMQGDGGYARDLLAYPELFAGGVSGAPANLIWTGTFDTDAEVSAGTVRPSNGAVEGIWEEAYRTIGRANNVLAALAVVDGVAEDDSAQFAGEAQFVRALNYHNLVRFFGGVPLVTEPTRELSGSTAVARSSEAQVYAQIEADLTSARRLLADGSGASVGHATQCAATALLSRVYLDAGKHAAARDAATDVIAGCGFRLVDDYGNAWRIENSTESIFEIQFTILDNNNLAFWFFPRVLGGRRGFAPTQSLFNAYRTTPADTVVVDRRRDYNIGIYNASGSRYGRKYFRIESNDDNVPVLRLAEMYLNRAEANWRLGAPAATVRADLNVIRSRARAVPLDESVSTSTQLRGAILNERRLEMALEGVRMFDVRRILGTAEAAALYRVDANKLYWPIPQQEINTNPSLTQNPGY
ncbi:MAG TPA: RagB/SusD family nutrient uptake outer membrane protein [Longimicrobium sp.]|jgi:hypothetical protein